MWYEELAKELLSVRDGGVRQFLIAYAREYAQGKALVLLELHASQKAYTPTKLAEALDLSSGRIANILKSLQRGGYVFRKKDDEDGRRVHIALTEKGTAKAVGLFDEQVAACGKMFQVLGEEDANELVRIMKRIPTLHI